MRPCKPWVWLTFFLLFVGSWPLLGAAADGSGRPRIGLALSGGGARGAAHIGVLKVLEELRIPIDYVAGTSMGSIVGALYASGKSPDEISEAMANIDWDHVFADDTPREDRSFRRKQDDRLYLVKHKPGIKEGSVRLPMALVEGQKFDLVLRKLMLPVSRVHDFDRLPIPFRAVATDLATGREVVLGKGDLAQAVRASMAVPGAFAAVELDGQTLVDGGMANNLPVSVVRQMGADIVIAVDISTPLLKREEITSILGVMEQLSGFLTRGNTERQIASLRPGDILITPELNQAGIGSSDFKRHEEAREIGERAARQVLGTGKGGIPRARPGTGSRTGRGTHPGAEPGSYRRLAQGSGRGIDGPSGLPERIDFVEIDNRSSISDKVIAAHLDIHAGDPLDIQRIEDGIAHAYGLGYFEKISYNLVERDGQQGIRFLVQEKSWGIDSLQMGLELFSAFGKGSGFNLGAAYTDANIGPNAGEWRTVLSLGEEDRLITEIYYPLDPANRWFVGADLGYESSLFRLFQDGQAQAEFATQQLGGHLRLGRNFGDSARVTLMLQRAGGHAEVATGNPSLVDYDYDVGRVSVSGAVDSLDNLIFPTHGHVGRVGYESSLTDLGSSANYDQVTLAYSAVQSWGNHSLELGGLLNSTLDDNAPLEGLFRLGGFLKLSGLEENALSGQHAGLLRGIYRYRLNDIMVPVYAGASLEVGNTWDRQEDISLNSAHWGGSLFLGADTPIGPAFFGYGNTDGDQGALYLILGQSWH